MISVPDPSPVDSLVVIAVALTPLLISLALRVRLFLLRRKTRKLTVQINETKRIWEENERRAKAAGIEMGEEG